MRSSFKMKTAMENMVALALLTAWELVLGTAHLASDPAKFFSQPPVLLSVDSGPPINYWVPISENNELYYSAVSLNKQLQEQNFGKGRTHSLMEINSQSLTSMRGWQINNFIPSQVQSHLFPLASDQERIKEIVHVNALKKIKGSAHGAFVGDFCSNMKSSTLVCRLEWGRHKFLQHSLNSSLLQPLSQILSLLHTILYRNTGIHAHTYTLCCKSLSLDGKARGQGMRTEKKDACGHVFLQKWKESPLTLKSCRWVIPLYLTLGLATWVALAKETLSNEVQVKVWKMLRYWVSASQEITISMSPRWEKRGQIMHGWHRANHQPCEWSHSRPSWESNEPACIMKSWKILSLLKPLGFREDCYTAKVLQLVLKPSQKWENTVDQVQPLFAEHFLVIKKTSI